MTEWHLIVDVALCENCGNCVLAAKDEHVGNDFPGYSAPHPAQGAGVVRIDRVVRGAGSQIDAAYLPRFCNHCADAPCQRAAPDAVRRRPDGIVIIDPIAARGRREIVEACPYGAVVWNDAEQLPQHWIFDAHLLDQGWPQPRCQQVCPTGAIAAVRLPAAAMAERAAAEGLEVLNGDIGTRPRVHYRNLHRVRACFIAGSVTGRAGEAIDCVAEAAVSLFHDGAVIARQATDAFGDFKFDRLPPGSGAYRVDIDHPRFGRASRAVTLLGESLALGDIALAEAAP